MRSEILCRIMFHYYVQEPFLLSSPSFLNKLELNGYCKKHEIAFEYHGIHHYSYTPFIHKSYKEFQLQQERDRIKNDLCKKYGLILITVPHIYNVRNALPMSYFIHNNLLKAEQIRNKIYMVNRCPFGLIESLGL